MISPLIITFFAIILLIFAIKKKNKKLKKIAITLIFLSLLATIFLIVAVLFSVDTCTDCYEVNLDDVPNGYYE